MISRESAIGIVGSGAMGSGIAQVAAMAGHRVFVFDTNTEALVRVDANLGKTLLKLEEKGKLESAAAVRDRIVFADTMEAFRDVSLVIEAIVENLQVKQSVFAQLENAVKEDCILATNTSSLSVTSIAASCKVPERVLGLHFFNPAPLMALVEVIPAVQSRPGLAASARELMSAWGKVPVTAKDTPGFIVNRVARPFYGEALRILEEGIADMATIDQAITEYGKFRMGPFTLMDYIGHDVNYVVTETVFQAFFYDPRYRPSFTQKRLLEAGWIGKKTGRGFYDYSTGAAMPEPVRDEQLARQILERVLSMLINEAVDALHLNIATASDLDLAMTKGVNYPKGLLKWCDELGAPRVLSVLDGLYEDYHEDRYRASVLLRRMADSGKSFF